MGSAALSMLVACGGASDTGLFGTGPSTGSDAGTSHDASTTVHADGGDTTVDGGVTLPDGATQPPPADGGTQPPPNDAGKPPPPPVDAGNDPGVRCGDLSSATYCPVPTELCCRRDQGQGPPSNTCVIAAGGALCAGGLSIPCDDAQDCETAGQPGTVCCVQADNQNIGTSVSCMPASECTGQNNRGILCNPTEPDPCPNGGTCGQSMVTLPGYDICR